MAPLQIGVTGGIGAGKSIVCRIFAALGTPVYDADSRAKWLTNSDPALRADIIALLGSNAYVPAADGALTYNRAWVAEQVFTNSPLLAKLNALIHPCVLADTEAWVKEHEHYPYLIKEAALMRAAGDHNTLDKVIVVTAPIDLRIARIRQRDPQRNEADIRNIMARQISDTDRLKIADYTIRNDETELLIPQVLHLHDQFSQVISEPENE